MKLHYIYLFRFLRQDAGGTALLVGIHCFFLYLLFKDIKELPVVDFGIFSVMLRD